MEIEAPLHHSESMVVKLQSDRAKKCQPNQNAIPLQSRAWYPSPVVTTPCDHRLASDQDRLSFTTPAFLPVCKPPLSPTAFHPTPRLVLVDSRSTHLKFENGWVGVQSDENGCSYFGSSQGVLVRESPEIGVG
eukprot:766899-Hanusia_phi.AAC.1